MAMKSRAATSFVMFDVVYEDGTRSSNRRVLASVLDGLNGDAPARTAIETQDQQISEASGRPRSNVRTIARSPVKPPDDLAGPDRKARRGR